MQHRMFRSNEPHSYYIDRTNHTTTKQNQNAYHGEGVYKHTEATRIESQSRPESKVMEGDSPEVTMLYGLRDTPETKNRHHYDPRTELWRGTPQK
jgi:hypothetical protein